ncbi:MAG: hypothetical protein IPL40_02435 [Proteobacteria bacterium]|nr:hypothetical protein [Pseudomonadota bacterium]
MIFDDARATEEIRDIAVNKAKAYVFDPSRGGIAVGHKIHVQLAGEIGASSGAAGFLVRSPTQEILVIPYNSPVDRSTPEMLQAVVAKLRNMGHRAALGPRSLLNARR